MDRINFRVLIKEPRGFIRILQVFIGLLAWSTTAGFSTTSVLHIYCPDNTSPFNVDLEVKYPFDIRTTKVSAPQNCSDDTDVVDDTFPIDFSATSMLYVAVCVLSLIYALSSAIYYCFFTAKYETDPLVPMVDLCITLLFTVAWIAITLTWWLNVTDLKLYTHPNYFRNWLSACLNDDIKCETSSPGKWSSLTVSIVCGLACVLMWLGSTWYIFKETTLHKKQTYQASTTQNSQSQ